MTQNNDLNSQASRCHCTALRKASPRNVMNAVIDGAEAEALSKLDAQFGALFRTEDFKEGRKAEAEGRPPI